MPVSVVPAKLTRKWRLSLLMLMLIVLLTGVGIAGWHYIQNNQDAAATYVSTLVERGNIENLVTATGILQPKDYVDVGAQVSGQLKKLHVEIGSDVKAGELLAEIDATVYRAKVDGIRAQLKNQQAQLKDRQAQTKLAEIQFVRQTNLHKDDATTRETLQSAEASVESAKAQQQALEAQIEQTQSSLRAEEANLAYAKIYAPIAGTVVSITSRQGQTLNTNQQAPTIMRIADLTTMTVQSQVSEADISKLQVGMPVYFTTLGGQDSRWWSTLSQIQPTPEVLNNVVLYNALFDVPNNNNQLKTQMSAQIFFIAAQAKDTLIIPVSAVNFRIKETAENSAQKNANPDKPSRQTQSQSPADGKNKSGAATADSSNDKAKKPSFVQVLLADGNIERRKVVLGISNRVHIQVLEGLQEGERVISANRVATKPTAKAPSTPGMGGGGFR